jgi:hypothetical protein
MDAAVLGQASHLIAVAVLAAARRPRVVLGVAFPAVLHGQLARVGPF